MNSQRYSPHLRELEQDKIGGNGLDISEQDKTPRRRRPNAGKGQKDICT